jgi:hypothetical protein
MAKVLTLYERRSDAAKKVEQRGAVAAKNLERRRRRAPRPQLRTLVELESSQYIPNILRSQCHGVTF